MSGFSLTAAARKDMLQIGRFAEQKWGKRQERGQRNKYLRQLDDAFRLLARRPEIGKAVDQLKPGYKQLTQGSHLIFYRVSSDNQIVVVRILHNSMDASRRL